MNELEGVISSSDEVAWFMSMEELWQQGKLDDDQQEYMAQTVLWRIQCEMMWDA